MSDLQTTQAAEVAEAIEPITSSADGQRNMHSLFCSARGQSMNYAACLWRQGVLNTPIPTKTPEDWNSCRTAACAGACVAMQMRKEELLAGKSIYFRARQAVWRIATHASDITRKWAEPAFAPKPKSIPGAAPKAAKSMLDAMGSMGSLADAVTEAAKTPTAAPVAATKVIPIAIANTGESPLAMARRIAAERSATI